MTNGTRQNGTAYKYVIECQACNTSLTIMYGTRDPGAATQDKIKHHLVDLMIQHLTHDPEPDDHVKVDIDPDKIMGWIHVIRSPP